MNRIALVLALAFGGVVLASPPAKIPLPRMFSVGIRAAGRLVRGSSSVAGAASLQLARQTTHVGNNGSAQIDVVYLTPGGRQLVTRQINIAPGCGVITDADGNVLAATTPAALCTWITNGGTAIEAFLGAAAAQNKLDLP